MAKPQFYALSKTNLRLGRIVNSLWRINEITRHETRVHEIDSRDGIHRGEVK